MEAVATFLELTLEQALLSGAGAVPKKSLAVENYSGFHLGKPEPKANPAGEEENIDKIIERFEYPLKICQILQRSTLNIDENKDYSKSSIVSNDDFEAAAGGFSQAAYSFPEDQFLAGLQYDALALDYVRLWYGNDKEKSAEYISGTDVSGTESTADSLTEGQSDMLTAKEAEEMFIEIQYSAMSGNIYQMNAQDLRKFNLSIIFDTALFKLKESLLGLTRNVNYWMM